MMFAHKIGLLDLKDDTITNLCTTGICLYNNVVFESEKLNLFGSRFTATKSTERTHGGLLVATSNGMIRY